MATRVRLLLLGIALGTSAVASQGVAAVNETHADTLVRAERIRAEVDAESRRARGVGLAVTEASSTAVVDSFALVDPRRPDARSVPAAGGVFCAICPVSATCPYPSRRLARAAVAVGPRRLALELAVRTFRESSAELVAVSLPTRPFVLFLAERSELDVLARTLAGDPADVDRGTRANVFVPLGLETGPSGGDVLVAAPRRP